MIRTISSLIFLFHALVVHAQVFDTLAIFDKKILLFDSDDDIPKVENDSILMELIRVSNESDQIWLEGHTDEVGSLAYNQNLSERRVERVKQLLLSKGVDEGKFKSDTFGETKPARKGSSAKAYQENRRVTIAFYKKYKMRTIQGQILDEESGEGISAKIVLTGKKFIDSTMTNDDGRYSIAAPDKAIYKIEAIGEDHFFQQKFIKISPLDPVDINLKLPRIEIGGIYTLPNFNFKGNLPVLLDSSVPTLELLYRMLTKNDFCFEIEGHINLPNQAPCEKDTWHYKLSVDRAEMVYNHMVKRGIKAERMLPVGYGNWEMLFPTTRIEKEMSQNRRVEIKIIDCKSEDLLEWHLK